MNNKLRHHHQQQHHYHHHHHLHSLSTRIFPIILLLDLLLLLIKFQEISAIYQNSDSQQQMPDGASCVIKPTSDLVALSQSDTKINFISDTDEVSSAFRQISQNSAQIRTKNLNVHKDNVVSYQRAFDSICNWTSTMDWKGSNPATYWVFDFKRAALVAKFAYYDKSEFTDTPEARLSSPIFEPIPRYHSMADSKYRGSCKVSYMSYITIPAHLDLNLVVTPTTTSADGRFANEKTHLIKKLMEGKNPRSKLVAADQGESAAWVKNEIIMPFNIGNSRYYLEFSAIPGAITSAAAQQHNYLNGVAIANFSLSRQCFGLDVDQQELERTKSISITGGVSATMSASSTTTTTGAVRKEKHYQFIEKNITFIVIIFILVAIIFIKFLLCSYLPQHKHYVVGPGKSTTINSELLEIQQRGLSPLGNILDCELVENPNYCHVFNTGDNLEISRALDAYKIDRKCLTLTKPLGKGAFGEVYKGYWICSDSSASTESGAAAAAACDYSNVLLDTETIEDGHSIEVAVKTLTDERMSEKDFLIEATNMSIIKHRNIVRFFGVCFEEKPLYIVMEYLPGGNLKNFLIKNRVLEPPVRLCMGDLLVFALDISRACNYLQKKEFIHRDLATRNCLLTANQKLPTHLDEWHFSHLMEHNGLTDSTNNHPHTHYKQSAEEMYLNGYKNSSIVAKLSDFGLTRRVHFTDYYRVGQKEMPVRWMPPECLDGVATFKSDVWSFGVFLWELFSMGQQPYQNLRENDDVVKFINSRRFIRHQPTPPPTSPSCATDLLNSIDDEPDQQVVNLPPPLPLPHYNTPQAVYDIMTSCWASDPQDRPQFEEISKKLILCLQRPDVLNEGLPCFSS